ncbi:putative disease resistance protein [Cinnamomum micranthum f. kanehirae]|uniref:Putative disease resistance protein n=1 Tax=Cinnamomum micranthum f. kanehirae TaxID=337451 RepID=A0A443N0G7_9MAGN|nr:putative disease resistance protein [Cinnamomum micranthum f. kanehirae]
MEITAPVLEIVKLLWSPIGRQVGYIKNLKRNMDDLEKHAPNLFAQLLDVQEMINTEQLRVETEECRCWINDVDKVKGEVESIIAKYEEDNKCLAGWCPNVKSRMELGKHTEDKSQEVKNLIRDQLAFAGREFRDAPLHDIKNLRRNMDDLEKNATPLFAQLLSVQEMIKTEQLKVATEECRRWIDDVEKVKGEVDSIKAKREEDISRWCPNVESRMELGKHIKDMIQEMKNLNSRRLAFAGREFRDAPLQMVEPQIVEINSSTDSEPRLQKILGLIEDVRIRKIGIWGMGGIGKTRTLKLLNNQLEESHIFDIVIWVTVSEKGSRRKVQNDIARRLNCTEKDMSNDDRLRASISKNLSRKKFLLILDDIWERIDLFEVGIPILNQDNGCKILLTTRDFGVCRQMETDVEIQMEKLSKEEAMSLFNKKVGAIATSPHIEPIARDIVQKCGGLPLAIIVIGSSLRNISDVAMWRNTLRELQSPCTSQIKGMKEEVSSCLKISYDRLPNDCERNLLLYCSLYPEDWKISITELAERCWLEGYIQGVDSIEKAWDKGRHMVINLVDASLLERGDNEERVKMHDIIRDFALKAASGFLVKTGKDVKHPPEEEEWLQAQKISLMGCSLVRLLKRPKCSTLSTLLLKNNSQLIVIPDSFFECMHSLCILDLSGTRIKSLPSSLWTLFNLRGLYLKGCHKLEELPSQVGALKQLEVLHLGGPTGIQYLPREVGELTRLKRLMVGFKKRMGRQNEEDTKEWNMKLRVPTGIIPKLPYLEELSLYVTGQSFCVEKKQWDDESMKVVVEELCRLEHLTYLDAYFPKVECLERFLRHRKSVKESWFRRFRFRVGTEKTDISWFNGDEEWERYLVYNGGFGKSHAAIMETLAHCSNFVLRDHRTARKLSELGLANMNELKECGIIGCDEMETLFDGDEQQETCALLPNLKKLKIESLPELRSLFDGPLLPGSLSKLRSLCLFECNNLKKVFQMGIIRELCNLESLKLWRISIEEIIEIEEEEEISNDRLILPNIKEIYLWSLPELVSICRGFSNFEWPSLENIHIRKCPKLKSLSFLSNGTNIVAPALKMIKGESSRWEALEWEDNDIKQRLQPFFSPY